MNEWIYPPELPKEKGVYEILLDPEKNLISHFNFNGKEWIGSLGTQIQNVPWKQNENIKKYSREFWDKTNWDWDCLIDFFDTAKSADWANGDLKDLALFVLDAEKNSTIDCVLENFAYMTLQKYQQKIEKIGKENGLLDELLQKIDILEI